MKPAISEIFDNVWCKASTQENFNPLPFFAVLDIKEKIEDVTIFPSAYIRTLVENLEQ